MEVTYVLYGGILLFAGVSLWLLFKKSHQNFLLGQMQNENLLLKNEKEAFELQLDDKNRFVDELQKKANELEKQSVKLQSDYENLLAKHEEVKGYSEQMEKRMTLHFENMANKIIEERNEGFRKRSQEGIEQMLNPLKERIFEFQKKVEDTYHAEARERIALKTELQRMIETNLKMSTETTNLTKALKGDVKAQGNWGEIILEKILESSGLREGEEFVAQGKDMGLKTESGKRQAPDVVVTLPDNKHIVIDSKVSLLHYNEYIESETDVIRESSQKKFIQSIHGHIDGLAKKKYSHNEKLMSPDFVLMFFPIEGAYSLALQLDSTLFQKSWERNIVIVGPTTLLASLKTVASLWKQERQNKNAMKIAAESGKLYDKFVGFVEDLDKIGDGLRKTEQSYQDAMGKLKFGKGNIYRKLEVIRDLGAKTSKVLPSNN